MRNSQTDAILINMPFASALAPSIALGLLKSILSREGIDSRVFYPSLRFAELIGFPPYKIISNSEIISNSDLAGEWIFSHALFNQTGNDTEEYLEQVLRKKSEVYAGHNQKSKKLSEELISQLLEVRSHVEPFLEECLREVIDAAPRVAAFTSVFQQNAPSLALAKLIKERSPNTKIIFGGANCDNLMGLELVRQFPFVDAVVSGEGDVVFPDFVQRVLDGKPFSNIPGVFTQDNYEWITKGRLFNAERVKNLDDLPVPDYDDYFEALGKCSIEFDDKNQPRLLMETSRGCWWGERSHCTFCGLNADTMSYGSKSAPRALAELNELTSRYPNRGLSMVDNILDMKYFKDFMPALALQKTQLDIFYEIKANLKKEQIKLLRDAGVTMLQPGVESFSTSILDIMGKGVKGIMNIQLLKWCKEFSITPFWNVLWGFPGEPPEEYARMAELTPLLMHLQPPVGTGTIRLDRFSPNFKQAEERGFVGLRPYPAYSQVYKGLSTEAASNLAYYFTFKYRVPQDVKSYTAPLLEQIDLWKKSYIFSDLFYNDKSTFLEVWDTRPSARKLMRHVSGTERVIYKQCDAIHDFGKLMKILKEQGIELSESELHDCLDKFIQDGLMVEENGLYLSLALMDGTYTPKETVMHRIVRLLTGADEVKELLHQASEKTTVEDVF